MSELNDDKKPIESRRTPLEGIEAKLRDQIPEKLAKRLEELEMGQRIGKIWLSGNANRAEWLERQQSYLMDWDEHLESTAEGPFQGSSSLHLPIPLIVCKTLHARFLQALLGIDPYFTVKPRTEAVVERAQMVQDLMSYALKDWMNEREGCEEAVDLWLWDWVTTGCGILKGGWECKYERFIDVEDVMEPGPMQFAVDQQGNEVQIPTLRKVEKEVKVTKKIFEGPTLTHRHPEDVLILGGKGDPKRADIVIDQDFLTASQLWTFVDRKIFREDAVRKIIDGGPDNESGQVNAAIKDLRAQNAGKSALDVDSDLDRYQVLEAYLACDVDGSGINTEIVVWVHPRSGEILRANFLRRMNKSGERPFFKVDFYKRAGQDYGTGLVEILHPLSKELDAMHNLRVDYGIFSTMPFGFYRATSSLEPETLQIKPGDLIPVDNPQTDVYFPNIGNRSAFGMQEESSIYTVIERLTGVNDMTLGAMSGAQGATRTATGARALLGESNANLDVFLRRLQKAWRRALQYTLHSLQQRVPDGMSFRVTGETGSDYWAQVKSSKDIEGDYDFEIAPNSANSNISIQQEVANNILNLTGNPLDIQLGIVTPQQRYEALRNFYKSLGVKDYGKYIQKPPQWMNNLSPGDEANRILRGIPVPVTPEMDHEGFIRYWEEIKGSDELLGQFTEAQTIELEKQAQQHAAMLQALEEQAAQMANVQQMRNNSVASQQQAPPGLNPMQQGPVGASSGQA